MKTTPWSERPLILHLCSRTFLLSSMVSGVEILKLWPVAWKPSVNPYRTWQKLSNWCMVKNKNKNKHSDSSAFKAITTTLTDTFFVKRTWILKSSTASWESSCPGIKLLCVFFFSFLPMTQQFFYTVNDDMQLCVRAKVERQPLYAKGPRLRGGASRTNGVFRRERRAEQPAALLRWTAGRRTWSQER